MEVVVEFKLTAVVAGLVVGLLSGAAHASVLDFRYYTDWAAKGETTTASGKIDLQYKIGTIYEIVGVSGVVDGSTITGLVETKSSALFADESGKTTGVNNASMHVNTAAGISYDFGFGIVTSSAGDVSFGRFDVSSVPLPGAAPMFGAALLGLGGLGYAAKRKTVAAA